LRRRAYGYEYEAAHGAQNLNSPTIVAGLAGVPPAMALSLTTLSVARRFF